MERKNEFILSVYVLSTHDDFDVIDDVEVGITERFELVIRLTRSYYGVPGEMFGHGKRVTETVTDFDHAFALSRRLGVTVRDLPRILANAVDREIIDEVFPSYDDTWDAFRRMQSVLDRHHCPYRLRKR